MRGAEYEVLLNVCVVFVFRGKEIHRNQNQQKGKSEKIKFTEVLNENANNKRG